MSFGPSRPVESRRVRRSAARGPALALLSLSLVAGGWGVVGAPATADTGVTPQRAGVIGGSGRADTYPSGLETTPDGGVVLADTGNDRVVKYSAAGAVQWIHGEGRGRTATGMDNPRDVGVDADGNVYVADTGSTSIVKLDADGDFVWRFVGSPGDPVVSPIGITFAHGEVLVADAGAGKVRVLDAAGHELRTVSQQGPECPWAAFRDVTADAAGNLYLANYTRNNILKLDADGTCLDSFGTKGTEDGQFKNPYGVAVADDPVFGESLYVADSNNNRIQVLSLSGVHRATIGGPGRFEEAGTFSELRRVAVAADGDVWGADLWGWRAERFNRTGGGWDYAQRIGTTKPGSTAKALFNQPQGMDVTPSGDIVVTDRMHHRFATFGKDGSLKRLCGGRGSGSLGFNWPADIAVDKATGQLWAVDTHQNRLQVITPSCGSSQPLGKAGAALGEFKFPSGIDVRNRDRIAFVADTNNNRLVAYDVATREPLGSAGLGLRRPQGVEVDSDGTVLVADRANNRVVRVSSPDGVSFSVEREYTPGLDKPAGVTADGKGRMYIADSINGRVVVLGRKGAVRGTIEGLDEPQSVMYAGGVLYVADTYRDKVRRYEWATTQRSAAPQLVSAESSAVAGRAAAKLRYLGDFASEGAAALTPVDVAVSDTHIFALDVARYRLVKISRATGSVVATTGGARGDEPGALAAARAVALAPNGDLYVADTPNHRVSVYDSADLSFKFDFGATGKGAGEFDQVYGLAIGRGDNGSGMGTILYTVDGDGRIGRWSLGGDYLGSLPIDITLDQPRMAEVNPATDDLWVVNARDREVVVFGPDGSLKDRFGRGGTDAGEFMGDPRGIAINDAGTRVFVSDEGNHRVQVFDGSGDYLDEASYDSGTYRLVDARGLEVDGGTLVVSDEWDHALKEFDASSLVGTRKLFGGDAPLGGVNTPRGLALNSRGQVYVSDWWNQRIQRWSAEGTNPKVFGYRGTTADPGSINFAWDVAIQPGTDRVFVANRESHEIEVFTRGGAYVTRWGLRGTRPGEFQFPQGVAFAPDGDLVVSDSANGRIQRFRINDAGKGSLVAVYGSEGDAVGQFSIPTGIAVSPSGAIWVADTDNNRIQKRNPRTGTWKAFTAPVGDDVNFRRPWGVSPTGSGKVWVTDSGRGRIVKLDASGDLLKAATGPEMGAGVLAQPFDTLVLPNGHLLVSDAFNNRIIEVAP